MKRSQESEERKFTYQSAKPAHLLAAQMCYHLMHHTVGYATPSNMPRWF